MAGDEHTPDVCDKGPEIKKLRDEQTEQGKLLASHDQKLDRVLQNQHDLGKTMTQALTRLTDMIEKDIGTRKDVEQGKKDIERLYTKAREIADHARDTRTVLSKEIHQIKVRNAKCDGAGIFENFPKVWDYIQQEKGWRRFFPALMAGLSFLVLVWDKFGKEIP